LATRQPSVIDAERRLEGVVRGHGVRQQGDVCAQTDSQSQVAHRVPPVLRIKGDLESPERDRAGARGAGERALIVEGAARLERVEGAEVPQPDPAYHLVVIEVEGLRVCTQRERMGAD